MIKSLICAAILIFSYLNSFCQKTNEIQAYKDLIVKADSINNMNIVFSVDSTTIIEGRELDNQNPQNYFMKASELMNEKKLHDAAFIYYLGILRYRYYNSVNPNYSESPDGALASSFEYVLGEPLNFFLKSNIDNFILALEFTIDYYKENDYYYFPKKDREEEYNKGVDFLTSTISELHTNKEQYTNEWIQQRQMFLDYFEAEK